MVRAQLGVVVLVLAAASAHAGPVSMVEEQVEEASVVMDTVESLENPPSTIGQLPFIRCDLYTLSVEPDRPPFIDYQIRPECLPA